ncbi:MAG: H-NS histone family protein [Rhodobacteraceae bacterium]|nr:H-NS histone family protein [Paracoccaceae bacterium]
MSAIDLDSLELGELKELQKDVAKAIASFEARKLKEARAKVTAAAQELGYSLEELVGGKAKGTKPAATPKYRHPENAELTWSGRGRQPAWFKEAVAGGVSPDDLEIG